MKTGDEPLGEISVKRDGEKATERERDSATRRDEPTGRNHAEERGEAKKMRLARASGVYAHSALASTSRTSTCRETAGFRSPLAECLSSSLASPNRCVVSEFLLTVTS